MIFIDRKTKDVHGNLIQPSAEWFTKANDLTEQAKREGRIEKKQLHYSASSAKIALEKLFHGKCAYCEQKLGETWDVEHFRPKGAVDEDKGHPGYYWMAYDWTNLYASCHACNTVMEDLPEWDDPTPGKTGGKGTHFPLSDPSKRAYKPDALVDEGQPLLLDPCDEKLNPELLILYDLKGIPYAFEDHPRAKTTIDICHLERRRHRKAVAQAIQVFLERAPRGADLKIEDSHAFAGALRGVLRDPAKFGLDENWLSAAQPQPSS